MGTERSRLRDALPAILAGVVIVALVLVVGKYGCYQAHGGTASIVSSFKSPCRNIRGIDYHAGYLYHAAISEGIVKTTTTGSVVQTIRALYTGAGLDRTNIEFWTCRGFINRLSTTGSLIRSISIPITGRGVAFGEGFLWLTGGDTRIYKITVNGSVVNSFTLPRCNSYGICYRAGYLWLAERSKGSIDHITIGGSFIESYDIPQDPYGVTREGAYVWYSDLKSGWVYKMLPIPTSSITPTSAGRIKALYR